MATLHKKGESKVVFVKGAPEKIIQFSSPRVGDSASHEKLHEVASNYAAEGLRVLAMAYKKVDETVTDIARVDLQSDLIFAGLQGMIDPPRQEVMDAIKECGNSGIRIAMITGDHMVTAGAVARQIGIVEDRYSVLEGRQIETMTDEDLLARVKDTSVYARVAPVHKLRIVQQLIKQGEVVAVTGDGVNDAPALKAAHIGVAMGKTGTDVAK